MYYNTSEYFRITDDITQELFDKSDCFPISMRVLGSLISKRGDNLNYLEFGTGRTCSAHRVAALPNVKRVISIDINKLDDRHCNRPLEKFIPFGGLPVDTPKGKWETKLDIIARLSHFPGQDKIEFWDGMDSNLIEISDFDGYGPFDVIYIDGDHTHDGVINDWNIAKQIIKPDGLIIFDDWGDLGCPEVRAGIKASALPECIYMFDDLGWHCAVDYRKSV